MTETNEFETLPDEEPTGAASESWRHPVNIAHLVMGIAFLGLVGIWAIVQSDLVDGADVRWLMPVPWVFAGAAGLLATTLAARRNANR